MADETELVEDDSTLEEDAEWLRRVARGQNALVRFRYFHSDAARNMERIADRIAQLGAALSAEPTVAPADPAR